MKDKNNGPAPSASDNTVKASRERLLKATEIAANFGLVLVAAGLVSPIVGFQDSLWLSVFKWVFTVGAAIYTIARLTGAFDKDEPFRIRRLRRLEVWAGFSFCIATFFWFYNTRQIDASAMPYMSFKMFQETILFTLVGALIQIIASWMLTSAIRKQQNNEDASDDRHRK